MKKNREEAADADKPAERDGVQQTQPMHRRPGQAVPKVLPPMRPDVQAVHSPNISVAPNHDCKEDGGRQHGQQRHSERAMPAHGISHAWRQKHRQHCPAVRRCGDAHRQPLIGGRIGPACDRKGHGKAGARHAEEKSDAEQLSKTSAAQPAPQQGRRFACQEAETRCLRAKAVAAQSDENSKQRAAQ